MSLKRFENYWLMHLTQINEKIYSSCSPGESHFCYLGRAVITVNPPSKVFPQDNYCFSDSSCSPCPSLFAQNILLSAIFLGQARATHVTSSWAYRQEKTKLKVRFPWVGLPKCSSQAIPSVPNRMLSDQ